MQDNYKEKAENGSLTENGELTEKNESENTDIISDENLSKKELKRRKKQQRLEEKQRAKELKKQEKAEKKNGKTDRKKTAKELDNERLKEERKKRSSKKENKIPKRKVKKSVQQTLPYVNICNDYIIEVEPNRYSKTYKFDDLNYTIANIEEQEAIFTGYCDVLNSFDPSMDIQITIQFLPSIPFTSFQCVTVAQISLPFILFADVFTKQSLFGAKADMENVANGIFAIFKSFVEGVIAILITIIIMMSINWILAVFVIFLSPLSVIMS